jgi:hypothetical protein
MITHSLGNYIAQCSWLADSNTPSKLVTIDREHNSLPGGGWGKILSGPPRAGTGQKAELTTWSRDGVE